MIRPDSCALHLKRLSILLTVELHPYLPQHELVKYLQDKGIVVEAYSPLGSTDSPLLKDPKIVKIAEAHGVGAGNVLISYQGKPRAL